MTGSITSLCVEVLSLITERRDGRSNSNGIHIFNEPPPPRLKNIRPIRAISLLHRQGKSHNRVSWVLSYMQMRSRGAELNPRSERWQWLQVPTACWSQSMWGIYFSTNCWHRCTYDELICMMGPHSFHPAAWWTGRHILKQDFCWARSKMNLNFPFFKNKGRAGGLIFYSGCVMIQRTSQIWCQSSTKGNKNTNQRAQCLWIKLPKNPLESKLCTSALQKIELVRLPAEPGDFTSTQWDNQCAPMYKVQRETINRGETVIKDRRLRLATNQLWPPSDNKS